MDGPQTFRASPLSRDLRGLVAPAAGLGASAALFAASLFFGIDALGAASGVAALVAICAGALVHQRAPIRRLPEVDVRLEGDGLFVGGRRFARTAFEHGVLVPVDDGALVQLRFSRLREPLVLHFADATAADALLASLGLGAESRSASFVVQSPWLAKTWFAPAWIGALVGLMALAIAGVALGWSPAIVYAALAFFVVPTAMASLPTRVEVGLDGLRVTTGGRSRFYPWSRVERVTAFRRKSVVDDLGGIDVAVAGRAAPLRVLMGTDALLGDTPERLVARIEQARATAERSAAAGGALTLRGSLADRVRAARAVLDGDAGYRDAHIDPAAVEGLVANPTAPVEDRIAAAVALVGADPVRGRRQVRIAAGTTADLEARAALEAAAETEDQAPALRLIAAHKRPG